MWVDYREQFCNLNCFDKLNTVFQRYANFAFQVFEEYGTPCGPATGKSKLGLLSERRIPGSKIVIFFRLFCLYLV